MECSEVNFDCEVTTNGFMKHLKLGAKLAGRKLQLYPCRNSFHFGKGLGAEVELCLCYSGCASSSRSALRLSNNVTSAFALFLPRHRVSHNLAVEISFKADGMRSTSVSGVIWRRRVRQGGLSRFLRSGGGERWTVRCSRSGIPYNYCII